MRASGMVRRAGQGGRKVMSWNPRRRDLIRLPSVARLRPWATGGFLWSPFHPVQYRGGYRVITRRLCARSGRTEIFQALAVPWRLRTAAVARAGDTIRCPWRAPAC